VAAVLETEQLHIHVGGAVDSPRSPRQLLDVCARKPTWFPELTPRSLSSVDADADRPIESCCPRRSATSGSATHRRSRQ
jgi:hypothetical protein